MERKPPVDPAADESPESGRDSAQVEHGELGQRLEAHFRRNARSAVEKLRQQGIAATGKPDGRRLRIPGDGKQPKARRAR